MSRIGLLWCQHRPKAKVRPPPLAPPLKLYLGKYLGNYIQPGSDGCLLHKSKQMKALSCLKHTRIRHFNTQPTFFLFTLPSLYTTASIPFPVLYRPDYQTRKFHIYLPYLSYNTASWVKFTSSLYPSPSSCFSLTLRAIQSQKQY